MVNIFGAKASHKEEPASNDVRFTQRPIDEIVTALVSSAYDGDEGVRDTIAQSLLQIGNVHPDLVISAIMAYIKSTKKLQHHHRVALLTVQSQVLDIVVNKMSEDLGKELISFAVAEMTASKDLVSDWQGTASKMLVTLFPNYPRPIIEELLKKFEPGVRPHFYVMFTLKDCANINPNKFVPSLKDVLSRTTPVLGMLKNEPERWVFAASLSKFSEAVISYNADETTDTVDFSFDILPAYEVVFNQWLAGREAKVRLAAAEAVGQMAACLSEVAFTEQLSRLLPAMLNMYRREEDKLPVTKGLCTILEIGSEACPSIVDGQLMGERGILTTLHQVVSVPPNPEQPNTFKNYNEVLRCFEILARHFTDATINFVMERIDSRDLNVKTGTLAVLKHLITRLSAELMIKRDLLVSGCSKLLQQKEPKIRKQFAMVVMAMASNGYLSAEGGQNFITFVVDLCGISEEELKKFKGRGGDAGVTPEELKRVGEDLLECLTSLPEMDRILWPFIFESTVATQYIDALPSVCKCISTIAARKKEAQDSSYRVDFNVEVNLPKPTEIAARMLVMLNNPFRRRTMGIRVCEALAAIAPLLHKNLGKGWGPKLGKLVQYLQDNPDGPDFDQDTWESHVLAFFEITLELIADEAWVTSLGSALADHLASYREEVIWKKACCKYLGMVCGKVTQKTFIRTQLDNIFSSSNHNIEEERVGCAHALGIASNAHLDLVLDKVADTIKKDAVSTSKGFFGLKKDKSDKDVDNIKCTIVLACGYIVKLAQKSLITSRLDSHVMKSLMPLLAEAKSNTLREGAIKTCEFIGTALHPDELGMTFSVKQRDEMLNNLISYMSPMKLGESTMDLRMAGVNACTTLLKLQPPLNEEMQKKVFSSTSYFFEIGHSHDPNAQISDLLEKLHLMYYTMLHSDPTAEVLFKLLLELDHWLVSSKTVKRDRASATALFLLKAYTEMRDSFPTEACTKQLADMVAETLGVVLVRCGDSHESIRLNAMSSLEMTLFIDRLLKVPDLKVETFKQKGARFFQQMEELRTRMQTVSFSEQMAVMGDVANILTELISKEQLPTVIMKLIEGLTDSESNSASGVCVLLNTIYQVRGEELLPHVGDFVQKMVDSMERISQDTVMNGTLRALRILATHHFLAVVDNLLDRPPNLSEEVVKSFQTLGVDDNLLPQLVDHLLETMNTSVLEENLGGDGKDSSKAKEMRSPTRPPMAATCALGNIFSLPELDTVIGKWYPKLMSTLLLRVGSASPFSDAARQVMDTFKAFLRTSKDETLLATMSEGNHWEKCLDEERFPEAVGVVAAHICNHNPSAVKKIFTYLQPFLRRPNAGQRIAVVSCLSTFISHSKEDAETLDGLVSTILNNVGDDNPALRIQALRGLGNLSLVGEPKMSPFNTQVLTALHTGMEDNEFSVALESTLNLIRMLETITVVDSVVPMVVNIAVRARHNFEKESVQMRVAAFQLFGRLTKFIQGTACEDNFLEQFHANFVCLLLHVNDEHHDVRSACKVALRQLAPHLRSPGLKEVFEAKSFDEKRKLDYDDFLLDVAGPVVQSYPKRVDGFLNNAIDQFKNEQAIIPANAAFLVGALLSKLTDDTKKSVSVDQYVQALIGLLKDPSISTRNTTVKALSLLREL